MHIKIKNIGKISNADMELNGVTLIVGDNNLGKTTSGRAVYTFFNSLYRIDNEVSAQRKRQILRLIGRFFEKYRRPFSDYYIVDSLIDNFLGDKGDIGEGIREHISRRLMPRASIREIDDFMGRLEEVRDLPNTTVRKQIIHDYFENVFSDQIVSLDSVLDGGFLHTEIEGHNINVDFQKDEILYKSDINIQHQAFFIDSPDLLNYWGRYRYMGAIGPAMSLTFTIRKAIDSALSDDANPADRAFDNILFSERYNKFVEEISEIMGGHFEFDKNGILKFIEKRMGEEEVASFDLNNVSEGLKAFGVIELMLRYHIFRDEDILIFDEPEIHLHPEWQIKYANLLVKLQKEFNLTILITTHSANFLMAIQFFAKIAKRSSVVNSYRIKREEKNSHYSVIASSDSSDWDESYISFIRASQLLDELREDAYKDYGE